MKSIFIEYINSAIKSVTSYFFTGTQENNTHLAHISEDKIV